MDNTGIELLADELFKKMSSGIVQFVFIKSDGAERTAFGTLQPNIIADTFGGRMHKARLDMIHRLWALSADSEVVISPGSELRDELKELLIVKFSESSKKEDPELVSYFDLGRQEWRSFKRNRLVKIVQ